MSARQAGQVAASGTTLVVTAPLRLDFELDERRRKSKDADQDALAIVQHSASQPEALCDPPDRGPEPYALDEASDPDGYSLDLVYCVQPPASQCNV